MMIYVYYPECNYSTELLDTISYRVKNFFVCIRAESNLEVIRQWKIDMVPAIIYDSTLLPLQGYQECKEFIDDFVHELKMSTRIKPNEERPPQRTQPKPTLTEKLKENDLETYLSERNAIFEGLPPPPLDRRMPKM